MFDIPQPDGGLQIHEQHPEYDRRGADAPIRVPDVLHPDVRAGGEEQPVNRYEEEAEHVRGEGDADEEQGEREALVLERVIDGTEEEVEGPEELETELEYEVGEYDQDPEDEELQVQEGAESKEFKG